jgi:hypothetical protein
LTGHRRNAGSWPARGGKNKNRHADTTRRKRAIDRDLVISQKGFISAGLKTGFRLLTRGMPPAPSPESTQVPARRNQFTGSPEQSTSFGHLRSKDPARRKQELIVYLDGTQWKKGFFTWDPHESAQHQEHLGGIRISGVRLHFWPRAVFCR